MAKCLRCGAGSEWLEGRVPGSDEQTWQLINSKLDELREAAGVDAGTSHEDLVETIRRIRGREHTNVETLKTLMERQAELQRLCAKAVKSGEPVFMGVWGPTGQTLYVSAAPKAPPSTGSTGNG